MQTVLEIGGLALFWLTASLLTYVYVGYPVVMFVWALRQSRRPSGRSRSSAF